MTTKLPPHTPTVNSDHETLMEFVEECDDRQDIEQLIACIDIYCAEDLRPRKDVKLSVALKAIALVAEAIAHDWCVCLSCLKYVALRDSYLQLALRYQVLYLTKRSAAKHPHRLPVIPRERVEALSR